VNYFSGPSHLGDALWCLHALRKIGGEHHFYTPEEYHWQLRDLIAGTMITLHPHENIPEDAKCSWIGCQRFQNQGVVWSNGPDVVDFLMRWNNCMCRENGVEPRFNDRHSMLADWPAISQHVDVGSFDVLIVNCPPRSGQCPRWDQGEMDALIHELGEKYRVIVTNPTTASKWITLPDGQTPTTGVWEIERSLSQIGNLHLQAKFTVAIASGAHWGCHSIWSQNAPLYLFLDEPLFLNYGRPLAHHGLVDGMRQQLITEGRI
jgi:hypothetical protein